MELMQLQMQAQLQAQVQAQAEVQRKELELRQQAQDADIELKRRAQDHEYELRRLVIDRADDNEKAANRRLANVDQWRANYAHRGQTYAMWYTSIATGAFGVAGLVCIFLAVASVIGSTVGLTAGGILLAGSLFTAIAGISGKFLKSDGDGGGAGASGGGPGTGGG
jgi:hypothetical protein